jgi:hypothetical protein
VNPGLDQPGEQEFSPRQVRLARIGGYWIRKQTKSGSRRGVATVRDEKTGTSIEVPEADAIEQQQAADFDDETAFDTTRLGSGALEADEADLIEQATAVADPDDEWAHDR